MKQKFVEHWPVLAAIAASLALSVLMVGRTSTALFGSSVENQNNSWATGSVVLAADGVATAVFDTATDGALTGGQTIHKCLKLDYTGTLAATVRLHGTTSGSLGDYIDLTIDQGTGNGPGGDCTGYVASTATLWSGTLAAFGVAAPDYSSGVAEWSATSNTSTVYRITATVQNVTGAQAKAATASFTWEARG
jgi:hypothetical protein